MLNIKFRVVFILIATTFQFVNAQTTSDKVQVTDLLKIKRAGNIKVSPDGNWALYNVNGFDSSKVSGKGLVSKSKLYRLNLSGDYQSNEFTEIGEGASQFAFSPDGKRLAFVRNIKGKSQIFTWTVGTTSTIQITTQKYGANNPVWSPDGKQIAFTSSLTLTELLADSSSNPNNIVPKWLHHPGQNFTWFSQRKVKADANGTPEEIRAFLDKSEAAKNAKVFTRLQFQTETSTSNEIRFSHVFITDVLSNASAKQLTFGFDSFSSPLFKDEKTLCINARINENHPDEELFQRIAKIDLQNGNLSFVLQNDKISYGLESISKNGKWLLYQTSVHGTVNVPLLFIKNTTKKETDVKIEIDRTADNFNFSEDDKLVYYTSSTNGGTVVCKTNLEDGKVIKLTKPDFGISDLAIVKNKVLFAGTNYKNPSEVYFSDPNLKNPQALTSINANWLKTKKLSVPEKHSFINDKGLTVEFWVMKPTDFNPNKKYPLLLEIHGGPASMYGPGDASMWHEFQYFAAQGIGVVYGNPRGSSGYGQKFLEANRLDWAEGPANDVIKSIDVTLKDGWADQEKLLVSGGSYGGYLSSWLISHSNRFLAASSQRGVYDFKTMFGEGNVWRIIPRYFDAFPWDKQSNDLLSSQSPFTYVNNIHTPLIIFAGENDGRVGYSQSDMLYKALKVLGRPVEYVRQPGASHEMVRSGDPNQRIDQMLRTYEFFDRYLNVQKNTSK